MELVPIDLSPKNREIKVYRATVDTPFGLFNVAVLTMDPYARQSILSVARSEFPCHPAMVKVKGEVVKSNRRIFKKMSPIKNAQSGGEHWAYFKRIKEQ